MGCEGVVGGCASCSEYAKENFHENEHDGRHIYRRNRDNDNQDAKNYNLRTHKEMNENPTYEHDTDAKTKKKDTQKYVENHNQEYN